jgi:hypothetical protein
MMKPMTIIGFLLFLASIAVFLLQMWFGIWGAEMFSKIIITIGAVFVICVVLAFLIKENKETDKINHGGGLN